MKYLYCIGIAIISLCMVLPVYAADLGVGISAWYADWEMENKGDPKSTMETMEQVRAWVLALPSLSSIISIF